MKTIKIAYLQQKPAEPPQSNQAGPDAGNVQIRQLLQLIKEYREKEEAFFDKIKRNEFAKDEKHHMMKCRQKLDYLLQTIQL